MKKHVCAWGNAWLGSPAVQARDLEVGREVGLVQGRRSRLQANLIIICRSSLEKASIMAQNRTMVGWSLL